MTTLDLVVKYKWYDMMDVGEKPEEYREMKLYWINRIMKCQKWCGCEVHLQRNDVSHCLESNRPFQQWHRCKNTWNFAALHNGYTHVRFHRGYTNITMTFEIHQIMIGRGNPAWGAPTDRDVFIIKLGERL